MPVDLAVPDLSRPPPDLSKSSCDCVQDYTAKLNACCQLQPDGGCTSHRDMGIIISCSSLCTVVTDSRTLYMQSKYYGVGGVLCATETTSETSSPPIIWTSTQTGGGHSIVNTQGPSGSSYTCDGLAIAAGGCVVDLGPSPSSARCVASPTCP